MVKPKKPTPIKIGEYGPAWTVRYVRRLAACWGWCDFDKREIVISNETKKAGLDRDTLIHEALHKMMPFLSEESVNHVATELDNILDACGY